jgi:hypothetical protein
MYRRHKLLSLLYEIQLRTITYSLLLFCFISLGFKYFSEFFVFEMLVINISSSRVRIDVDKIYFTHFFFMSLIFKCV